MCIRVPALPGLVDQGDSSAAEEKKKAYQLELQRQVCLFLVQICQLLLLFIVKSYAKYTSKKEFETIKNNLMPGFWNLSYPENLELSLEQETVAF